MFVLSAGAGCLCSSESLCINKMVSYSDIKRLTMTTDDDLTRAWWKRVEAYLLWPQLHLCDPGRIHHGFGPAQVLYQALPLGWQAHKASLLGVEWGMDTVFEIFGGWYFRPLLFLFAKHPQAHQGGSLSSSKCLCREKYPAFHKLSICHIFKQL